jgi:adenine deaminase
LKIIKALLSLLYEQTRPPKHHLFLTSRKENIIHKKSKRSRVVLASKNKRKFNCRMRRRDKVHAVAVLPPSIRVEERIKVIKVDTVELDEDVTLVVGKMGAVARVVAVAEIVLLTGHETSDGALETGFDTVFLRPLESPGRS